MTVKAFEAESKARRRKGWSRHRLAFQFVLGIVAMALFPCQLLNAAGTHTARGSVAESIRVARTPASQPRPTDPPAVQAAAPRQLVAKIGGDFSEIRLSGTSLQRVTRAAIINSRGQEAAGFDVRINSRQRTSERLSLSVIADKPLAPGTFSLRLFYNEIDPRPSLEPRTPIVRSIDIATTVVSVGAVAMEPRIVALVPELPHVVGHNTLLQVTIADLPGNQVESVMLPRRPQGQNCGHENYTIPSEPAGHQTRWLTNNTLEVSYNAGRLLAPYGSSCQLYLSIRTRTQMNQSYYSIVRTWVNFVEPERRSFRIGNTADLEGYLKISPDNVLVPVGACTGRSLGGSGSIPVGVINISRDLALRVRSGPIGTTCRWVIYTPKLRDGWELRLNLVRREVGDKCNTDSGIEAGGPFDQLRAHYHSGNGTVWLSRPSPNGSMPSGSVENVNKHIRYVRMACGPTLSNDHGVEVQIESAEVVRTIFPGEMIHGLENCTWRCAFND